MIHRMWRVVGCGLAITLLLLPTPHPAAAQTPEWVEPQALNIVDIAGQGFDEALEGLIVAYSSAGGLARFVSSEETDGLMHVTVRIDTRRFPSATDGWYTSSPPSASVPRETTWLDRSRGLGPRLRRRPPNSRGILPLFYVEGILRTPETDASAGNRYPVLYTTDLPLEEHGRRMPANMGGELALIGDLPVVTAVYTFPRPTFTAAAHLGTQWTEFPSYIAPPDGGAGLIRPLVEQMYARYGAEVGGVRHPRIPLQVPAGANYVLFHYPPMLMDVYDQSRDNLERPTPGTVRLAPDEGMLSTDMVHGGAFPLRVVWQDADQSAGPYLSILPPVDRVTPPEFFCRRAFRTIRATSGATAAPTSCSASLTRGPRWASST